jgi:autotransporter-associated beta strand protein
VDFTNVFNGTAATKRQLIFHGTTAQTLQGIISTGNCNVQILGGDNSGIVPIYAYDIFRLTLNTPAGQVYSYKGAIKDADASLIPAFPMVCVIKDGPGKQILIDRTATDTIGGFMSGGLEVKNGELDCTQATLPDCQGISDIISSPGNPHDGEQSLAGHYTITGGTLKIGTKNAGNSSNRGIGQFQITGGTVDADASAPGTIFSNHDFDIQGGTVNAVLAGTGHLQGLTTAYIQGLNKTTDSTATLGAPNLYSGPTIIAEGTLALSEFGQISVASPITNNATFEILAGTHTVGTIVGSGTTQVDGSATLNASSIVQGTLMIGQGTLMIGSSLRAANTTSSVPEPSSMVLLSIAALGFLFVARRRS